MGSHVSLTEASCKLAAKTFCPQGKTLKSEADFCLNKGAFCIVNTMMTNALLPTCADDAYCAAGAAKKFCCSDLAKVTDMLCVDVDADKLKNELAMCKDKLNLANEPWHDSMDNYCEDYITKPGWCKDADNFKYDSSGTGKQESASESCCVCGGGTREQVC